ncbi:uncharacterized protein LOC128883392 isoform X2 [Hylaeus volcanicus]|uniref:uncharacterized protein LOC128883392 isoform X2 n=1 Tax=Hylaeus volcanicus TaxID=313075 RepID=UPI0023B8413F|nr:uncharacterized protein LOC128883392 isoform X2 [Hylaeus volcanicus]
MNHLTSAVKQLLTPLSPIKISFFYKIPGELLACLVVLFVFSFMLRGRHQNKQISLNYANALHTIAACSFKQAAFPTSLLKSYGWSHYEYFATCHPFCTYLLVRFELLARQCCWQTLLSTIRHKTDLLHIEMRLPMSPKFTLLIGQRLQLKSLLETFPTIVETLNVQKVNDIPPGYSVLSDAKLIPELIFSACPSFCQLLQCIPCDDLNYCIVSDLIESPRYPEIKHGVLLQLCCAMPSTTLFPMYIETLLSLSKTVCGLDLPEKTKASLKKLRRDTEKFRGDSLDYEAAKVTPNNTNKSDTCQTPVLKTKKQNKLKDRREAKKSSIRVKLIKV